MTKDKIMKTIFADIAVEYGMSKQEVEDIFESEWDFFVKTVSALDISDLTEDEFDGLKTNFNIPSLGKLYTTFNKIERVKEQARLTRERRNAPKDDVQPTIGNGSEESS